MPSKSGEVLYYNKKKGLGTVKTSDDQVFCFRKEDISEGIMISEGDLVTFNFKNATIDGAMSAYNLRRV